MSLVETQLPAIAESPNRAFGDERATCAQFAATVKPPVLADAPGAEKIATKAPSGVHLDSAGQPRRTHLILLSIGVVAALLCIAAFIAHRARPMAAAGLTMPTTALSVSRKQTEPIPSVAPASATVETPNQDNAVAAATTVRAFYTALGRGDGDAASNMVIPEKRSSGPYAPESITHFYGSLTEPLQLVDLTPQAPSEYLVGYRFRLGNRSCEGRAIVTTTQREGVNLIEKIHPLDGC